MKLEMNAVFSSALLSALVPSLAFQLKSAPRTTHQLFSRASQTQNHVSQLYSSTTTDAQIIDSNPFTSFLTKLTSSSSSSPNKMQPSSSVELFYEALNSGNSAQAASYFTDDAILTDTNYYDSIVGKSDIQRHFFLERGAADSTQQRVIDDIVVGSDGTSACTLWHMEVNGTPIDGSRAVSFYNIDAPTGLISSAMDVPEPSSKPGDVGLNILNAASKVIDSTGVGYLDVVADATSASLSSMNAVDRYFDAWNRRDMTTAVACFTDDCTYEDTQYPNAFVGKANLERHLLRVADCLPTSFEFVVDNLAVSSDKTKVGVQWHLENGDGEALPFTIGASFYKLDKSSGLICDGFDVPEPAVIKTGSVQLLSGTIQQKVAQEPIRMVPVVTWLAYMGIVFFSDGILPGANALQLEQRTWEEVRDLSINFFLVSPLLHLPFAPVVHPMLEGVFNLLLSWAAMFAGFLSDEREEKPNVFPMLPAVAGMQFLTSAFLLPYLALRTSEDLQDGAAPIAKNSISSIEGTLGEFRGLGALMSLVGTGSIAWFFLGRPEFGAFDERFTSFIDLLSIDRVGSSFIVDLVIFALFQGWLVDDDLKRRGVVGGEMTALRSVAKFVPFFGLAAYLSLRPALPEGEADMN